MDQINARFFRYLIDVDNKLPLDYYKKLMGSDVNASYFYQFNGKENKFYPTQFSILFDMCKEHYREYGAAPTDTTLYHLLHKDAVLDATSRRNIETLINEVRQIPLEPTQFEAVRDEVRNEFIRNHSFHIYQLALNNGIENPTKGLHYAQNEIASLLSATTVNEAIDEKPKFLWQLLEHELKEFEESGNFMSGGIPYGFLEFDRALGAMYPGELIVVCGPPGVGKSMICGEIGYNAADSGRKTVVANREMLDKQVAIRYVSRLTKIPSKKLKNGALLSDGEKALVKSAMTKLIEIKSSNLFFIPPSKCNTVANITREIEHAFGSDRPELIVVDYLNDLEVDSRETGSDRIGTITQQLKGLSVHFQCPVISPTQPSSAGLGAMNPTMSDVGYKIINQKADTIFFLTEDPDHRYVPPLLETDLGTPGIILAKVIKARNDAKPIQPFRLQVEFATASIGSGSGTKSAIGSTVANY